jgi:hypothetical protein
MDVEQRRAPKAGVIDAQRVVTPARALTEAVT